MASLVAHDPAAAAYHSHRRTDAAGTPLGDGLSLPRVKGRHSFRKDLISSRVPKEEFARGTDGGSKGRVCRQRCGLRLRRSERGRGRKRRHGGGGDHWQGLHFREVR